MQDNIQEGDDLPTAILRTRGKIEYNIPPLTIPQLEEINNNDFEELRKIGIEQVNYFEQETSPELFRNSSRREGWILSYLYKPEFVMPMTFTKRYGMVLRKDGSSELKRFTVLMHFSGEKIHVNFTKPVIFRHKGVRSSAGDLDHHATCYIQRNIWGLKKLPTAVNTLYHDGEVVEEEVSDQTTRERYYINYENINSHYEVFSLHPHMSSGSGGIGGDLFRMVQSMDDYHERSTLQKLENVFRDCSAGNLCTGSMFNNTKMSDILNCSGFIFRLHKMFFKPYWNGAYMSLNTMQKYLFFMMVDALEPYKEAVRRIKDGDTDNVITINITPEIVEEAWKNHTGKDFGIEWKVEPTTDWAVDFSQNNYSGMTTPVEEIPHLTEVFSKFSNMQDIYKTITMGVSVIGLGNLGSRIATDLKSMGFEKFSLIDDDTVELSNLYTQAYNHKDVGTSKVRALYDILKDKSIFRKESRFHKSNDIRSLQDKFVYNPMDVDSNISEKFLNKTSDDNPFRDYKSIYNYNIFIVATDNMESRREAWKWVKEWGLPTWIDESVEVTKTTYPIYIDVRMGRHFIQVWAFNPDCSIAVKGYEKILEVEPFSEEVCGETSHNYMGTTVSAVVQRVILNYLKEEKYPYMTHITNDLQIYTRELPDEEPVVKRKLIYGREFTTEEITEQVNPDVKFYFHHSETDQYMLFKYLKERLGDDDVKKLYKTSDWFAIADYIKIRKVCSFPDGKIINRASYKGIRPVFEHNFGGGWSYSRRIAKDFKEALKDFSFCDSCKIKPFKSICEKQGCMILTDDNVKVIGQGQPIHIVGLQRIMNKHKVNKFFSL